MEKLQWFKFSPTDWTLGKIQRTSEITQLRFIRLICLYWNKECCLSYDDAEIEIDKEHLDILISKKIVKNISGNISIDFLDEQMDGISETSQKRRDAVNERWAKTKRLKEVQNDTSVLQLNEFVLQKDTEESRVDTDKNRVENKSVFSFDEFWSLYPKKSGKEPCSKKYEKISETDRQNIKETLADFIRHKPFKDYTHPNPLTYLNQKRWQDERPNLLTDITSIKDDRISSITKSIRESHNGRI